MSGLRERRHAETRQAIVDTAFALFERHGFSDTAMDRIAEHAGVSRSTLYRRYSSKEDIVLDVPRRWLTAWDVAIAELEPNTGLSDAMATGCRAVANEIDENRSQVLLAFQALSESTTLSASGAANRDWQDRITAMVASRAPQLPTAETMTIAGAYMGAIDTMMQQWAASGGATKVVDATDRLLIQLAPILP